MEASRTPQAHSPSGRVFRILGYQGWGEGTGGGTWMVSKAWRCLVKDASGGVSGDALSLLTGAEPGPALMAQGSISFPGSGPTVRRLGEQGCLTSSTSEAPCIRRRSPPPPPPEERRRVAVLPGVKGSERLADSVNLPSLRLLPDLSIRCFPPKPHIERATLLFSRGSEGVPLDRGSIRAPANEGHAGGPPPTLLSARLRQLWSGPPLAVTGAATEAVQGPEAGRPRRLSLAAVKVLVHGRISPFRAPLCLLPTPVVSALRVRAGPLALSRKRLSAESTPSCAKQVSRLSCPEPCVLSSPRFPLARFLT